MSMTHVATSIDLAAMALSFGATVWFFFVQSPVLLKRMGREAFVPMQMRLTVVLFEFLTVVSLVGLAAAFLVAPMPSILLGSAGLAAVATLTNKFVIVPQALRAGGRTRKSVRGLDHEASTIAFADQGVGAGTKTFHRLVVLFVVIMLAANVCHTARLVSV